MLERETPVQPERHLMMSDDSFKIIFNFYVAWSKPTIQKNNGHVNTRKQNYSKLKFILRKFQTLLIWHQIEKKESWIKHNTYNLYLEWLCKYNSKQSQQSSRLPCKHKELGMRGTPDIHEVITMDVRALYLPVSDLLQTGPEFPAWIRYTFQLLLCSVQVWKVRPRGWKELRKWFGQTVRELRGAFEPYMWLYFL